jgi:hypothetical protein
LVLAITSVLERRSCDGVADVEASVVDARYRTRATGENSVIDRHFDGGAVDHSRVFEDPRHRMPARSD